uniref:Uncharacterized protein n=1 Tax=Anopheles farauti TaxID=69004 RepID=A0A182QFT7_9DIPT
MQHRILVTIGDDPETHETSSASSADGRSPSSTSSSESSDCCEVSCRSLPTAVGVVLVVVVMVGCGVTRGNGGSVGRETVRTAVNEAGLGLLCLPVTTVAATSLLLVPGPGLFGLALPVRPGFFVFRVGLPLGGSVVPFRTGAGSFFPVLLVLPGADDRLVRLLLTTRTYRGTDGTLRLLAGTWFARTANRPRTHLLSRQLHQRLGRLAQLVQAVLHVIGTKSLRNQLLDPIVGHRLREGLRVGGQLAERPVDWDLNLARLARFVQRQVERSPGVGVRRRGGKYASEASLLEMEDELYCAF